MGGSRPCILRSMAGFWPGASLNILQQIEANEIEPIDIVAVNLYPFRETIAKKDVTLEEAIENIDIGGPTMVRSAAKNYQDVIIIVKPEFYGPVLHELETEG